LRRRPNPRPCCGAIEVCNWPLLPASLAGAANIHNLAYKATQLGVDLAFDVALYVMVRLTRFVKNAAVNRESQRPSSLRYAANVRLV